MTIHIYLESYVHKPSMILYVYMKLLFILSLRFSSNSKHIFCDCQRETYLLEKGEFRQCRPTATLKMCKPLLQLNLIEVSSNKISTNLLDMIWKITSELRWEICSTGFHEKTFTAECVSNKSKTSVVSNNRLERTSTRRNWHK